MTIFDWTKEITDNKRDWDTFLPEDRKAFNVFMINRILSMNPDNISFINQYQKTVYNMDPKDVYLIYCAVMPYHDRFYPYIKNKSGTAKYPGWVYTTLARVYWKISEKEVKEYLKILSVDEVTELLQLCAIDEDKIKKMKVK